MHLALYLQLALSHRFSAGQLLKGYFEHTTREFLLSAGALWIAMCGSHDHGCALCGEHTSIVFVDVISVGFDA